MSDSSERGESTSLKTWQKWWFAVLALAALGLLAGHTFWSDHVSVDTTSLGLLIVLAVLPLITRVSRLKFGGVEAELTPDEALKRVAKAEEQAEALPRMVRIQEGAEAAPESERYRKWVVDLDDPAKALAIDRIELERAMLRLLPEGRRPRPLGLSRLAEQLYAEEMIARGALDAIRDVVPVLNAGAHGDLTDWDIAFRVHGTIEDLTAYLATVEPQG